ncbi:uncharacterized protein [Anabrus simplex]|uniref:uncharacterized protein n=1 Tax=Anabrus simplex TaxID=316456 RepID=UPI0035A264C8
MAHITLDNVAYYRSQQYTSLQLLKQPGEMHGARRVIVFCLLIAVLPTALLIVSLYLRHSVYADVTYAVAESDVLEVLDGMSTVFCQEQVLTMNSSFHAFQLQSVPKLSHNKKYIHLKKSMVLPDDTLEYWGFFLLRGSQVTIKTCARHEGARVLMVEGEKNLRTCGLMQHAKYPSLPAHTIPRQLPKVETAPIPADLELKHQPPENITDESRENEFEGENEEDEKNEGDKSVINKSSIVEDTIESDVKLLTEQAITHIKKHLNLSSTSDNRTLPKYSAESSIEYPDEGHSVSTNATLRVRKDGDSWNQHRRVRHAKRRLLDMEKNHGSSDDQSRSAEWMLRRARLQETLSGIKETTDGYKSKHKTKDVEIQGENMDLLKGKDNARMKRDLKPGIMLDGGIGHGGNAGNITEILEDESSESSFEINLLQCYKDSHLFTLDITPSHSCSSEGVNSYYTYNVTSDGYYYYIFFSDNDLYVNSIHAIFDIYKTTYEFTNYTRGCINKTECKFPIAFWSDDIVIAEIPTRDGIEHEDDDMSYLVSSCYPRMSVYVIFPVTVLFLILGCAFL